MHPPVAIFRCLGGLLFGLTAAAAASGAPLTIATYNVENYLATDRVMEDGFRSSYPKPEREKNALRAVIIALDADILALQEMGPTPYLDELARDLKAEGAEYPYTALLEGPDVDRHLALLSRLPFKEVRRYADLTFSYFGRTERVKRGLLEITWALPSGGLTVFAVHLKSRLTDRPDDPLSAVRRAEEATAIREVIRARFPDPKSARFIVVGDCNDGPSSRPVERLRRRGAAEIVELLPAADSRGDTWTYYYRSEESYSSFDHIFVSPPIGLEVAGRRAQIFDGPETRLASDHRPVKVVLEETEAKAPSKPAK